MQAVRCGVDKEGGGRAVSDRGRSLRVGGEGKIREGGEDMKQGWMEGRKAEKKNSSSSISLFSCSDELGLTSGGLIRNQTSSPALANWVQTQH